MKFLCRKCSPPKWVDNGRYIYPSCLPNSALQMLGALQKQDETRETQVPCASPWRLRLSQNIPNESESRDSNETRPKLSWETVGNSSLRDTEFECLKDTGGEIGAPLLAWADALRLGGGYRHAWYHLVQHNQHMSMPDFAARSCLLSVEFPTAVILTVNSCGSSDFFDSTSL